MADLPSIDTILLKQTSLNKEQIKQLLDSTDANGTRLLDVLDSKSYETSDELIKGLCHYLNIEFTDTLNINDVPIKLINDIPISYAKNFEILPYRESETEVFVVTSNPINFETLDNLRALFQKKVTPIVCTKRLLLESIDKVYEKSTANLEGLDDIEDDDYDLEDTTVDLLESGEDDAPVIKLVNTLIFRAVKEKASDIHIEPYEKDMLVRFRVDGVLYDVFKPPKKLQNSITSRIKIMGNLNIAENRLPQDGRIPIKIGGKDIDIRLNSVPTAFGERLVMRLQDRSNVILSLEQIGFSNSNLNALHELLTRTYGIVLVTGPTGSGKSTTLYASLQHLNSADTNIITVEDPVEQRIHGIGQIQVNHKIGLTFSSGLRAILRQDPNTVMIGEIRDLETAEIAINASLTGHLVLSTIHTNDSAGAFPRLIDMGCEPFLIATSLLGVISQRLVRVLCHSCKKAYSPSDAEILSIGVNREEADKTEIFRAVGCDKCNNKGYSGRTLIQELLLVTEEIRTLVMQRKDSGAIKKLAVDQGMVTFRDHGIEKILSGITTIEEVISNTQTDL